MSIWRQTLVTGANRGLGLEFTRQLLASGSSVIACCREPAHADALVALAEAHPQRLQIEALDVADDDALSALAARLGRQLSTLDLLINNAGVLVSGERFGKVRGESLANSFAVNASAPLLLTQALAPLLEKSHRAHVMCVSTQLASIAQASAFRTVSYAMSKAALNMAVRRLAAVLGERGICVVAVHPGWLQTRMGGDGASMAADTSAQLLLHWLAQRQPADGGRFHAYDGTALPW